MIWIESIPFTETRNYVMRVLEGLHVYRARLQGRSAPLRLIADLGADAEVHLSTRELEGEAAASAMAAEARLARPRAILPDQPAGALPEPRLPEHRRRPERACGSV